MGGKVVRLTIDEMENEIDEVIFEVSEGLYHVEIVSDDGMVLVNIVKPKVNNREV